MSSPGVRRGSSCGFTAWHNGVTKPVIAAVNGVCAGGGLHFVADADIVIAASDATFLDPHVSVGQASVYETIAPGAKSRGRSGLADGARRPARAALGRRAYELGMVCEVVDPPERLRDAQARAKHVRGAGRARASTLKELALRRSGARGTACERTP